MASINHKKWEELDITRDELESIGKALKQKEFRDLLVEYVEEINDPENRKLYEKEITELEKQRGVEVTFIHPSPGYVIKTSVNGEKKAFINICKNDKVGKPSSAPAKNSEIPGLQWSIPYCQAPPREDIDKNKNRCLVYDVIFHSDTLHLANRNGRFKILVNDTALSAVEDSFKIQLDKKNLKFPKMHYKGMKQPVVIRKKIQSYIVVDEDIIEIPNYPYPPIAEESEKKVCTVQEPEKPKENETVYSTPKYVMKYRDNVDIQDYTTGKMSKINASIPKELVVEVDLPLLKTTNDVALDVTERNLSLLSEKPSKYKLFLNLPYCVNKDDGSAKFDKSLRKLIVTLPVKYKNYSAVEEDSGVESDLGIGRGNGTSSGDEEGTNEKMPLVSEISEIINNKICDDNSYRTKNSEAVMFLNPDVHYSVPSFVCNTTDDVIAFVMHVRNVDPSSVFHSMHKDSIHACFQVRFTSVGSGFFPMNYAFCVKLPNKVNISESVNVEVWDNNVIAQLKLTSCDTEVLTEYFVGTGEHDLKAYTFPEPVSIIKTALLSKTNSEVAITGNVEVQILERSDEKLSLNIEKDKTVLCEEDEKEQYNVIQSEESQGLPGITDTVNLGPSDNDKRNEDTKRVIRFSSRPTETNGYSSSFDEGTPSPTKFLPPKTRTCSESTTAETRHLRFRGILKVGRSLSESSVDDYLSWSVEKDSTSMKKTVRFSDVICKKTFRSNSSILGQRKKNQRKIKNKKRAQQRRTSESGGESEGEVETSKEVGGNLNRNHEEFYNGYSEESDLSEVSEISDVSESDDGEQQKYGTIKNEMSKSKHKQHKRGGKKNARKEAAAAKFKVYCDVLSD